MPGSCQMDGWGGAGMVLVSLLFLGLAVAGAVLLVRAFTGEGRRAQLHDGRGRAMAVLEERYARGEIARDEFEERRETLLR